MSSPRAVGRGFLVACALLIVAAAARAGDGDIPITVKPWPAPTVETYDPTVPAERPPELKPGEDGVAISPVDVGSDDPENVMLDNTADGVKVTKVKGLEVTGGTTIKIPTDATEKLKEHEQGHDTLAKGEYEKNAERKVKAAFAGFVGMTFVGKGDTPLQRQTDAANQAAEEYNRRLDLAIKGILGQAKALNDKYDDLTNHGKGTGDGVEKGPDGKITPLTNPLGITAALAEKAKAPGAGDHGFIPALDLDHAYAANVPVGFDDASGLITIGSPVAFSSALTPGDPLLTGAFLEVDPLQLIGWQDNGTALLGDGRARITDGLGGVFMDAYLFELAFMSSVLPGYGSMIQGYLDIPPEFAGGFVPGTSPTLDGLASASGSAADYSMFYMFFDFDIPLDIHGHFTTTSATATALLATAVSEPASLPLAALGLGFLLALTRTKKHHRKSAP